MGVVDTVRKRLEGRSSLEEKLADAKTKRAELDARRQSSRQVRLANADGSIAAALEWLDGQLRKYGGSVRELRAVPGPDGQMPMVAQWIAVAGGPAALRERWQAVLAKVDGLHDDDVAALDRETAAVDAELARLDGEIAVMDAERAELRDALS